MAARSQSTPELSFTEFIKDSSSMVVDVPKELSIAVLRKEHIGSIVEQQAVLKNIHAKLDKFSDNRTPPPHQQRHHGHHGGGNLPRVANSRASSSKTPASSRRRRRWWNVPPSPAVPLTNSQKAAANREHWKSARAFVLKDLQKLRQKRKQSRLFGTNGSTDKGQIGKWRSDSSLSTGDAPSLEHGLMRTFIEDKWLKDLQAESEDFASEALFHEVRLREAFAATEGLGVPNWVLGGLGSHKGRGMRLGRSPTQREPPQTNQTQPGPDPCYCLPGFSYDQVCSVPVFCTDILYT